MSGAYTPPPSPDEPTRRLYEAIERSDPFALRLALADGADPNYRYLEDGGPLWRAVDQNDRDSVEVLLAAGARANALLPGNMLYDLAAVHYHMRAFGSSAGRVPGPHPYSNADDYLAFAERITEREGLERPIILRLLREHGACTAGEVRCGKRPWPPSRRAG